VWICGRSIYAQGLGSKWALRCVLTGGVEGRHGKAGFKQELARALNIFGRRLEGFSVDPGLVF